MTAKRKGRIPVDGAMTLLMLGLMGYHLWGEQVHEWMGAALFALFLLHHILNRRWYRGLFRGKYTPVRTAGTLVDVLLLLAVAAQACSGVVLSRYVFDFLPIGGGAALARKLHILGAYWGYILMSLHLGLHWGALMGAVKKHMPAEKRAGVRTILCRILGGVIAGYGLFALIKRQIPGNLFLRHEFIFLAFGESKVLFYLDYLAIMGLFILTGHILAKVLRRRKKPAPAGRER